MAASNFFSGILLFALSAAVLLLLQPACQKARQSTDPSVPFYVQHGNTVQEHYQTYSNRLQAYYESLSARLTSTAPELLSLLQPPEPLQHGYQILPKIVADRPLSTHHPRTQSAQYSWPWTEHLIGRAMSEIDRAMGELSRALELKPLTRWSIYEQLASGYHRIREQQQNIDAHIQYNRLWQAAIATEPARFAKETVLHDRVLRRQAVLEVFDAREAAALKSTPGEINPALVEALDEFSSGLRRMERLLASEIEAATESFNLPRYLRVERQTQHSWIVRVPFYTDIVDSDFVQSAKKQIEKTWHLRSGDDEFRIELDFSYLSPTTLYGSAKPPQNGGRIAVQEHLGLFPTDRAILTTGASTTHVRGRAIILGPHDITPRVLAHEFGHVLGFTDSYFRGYEDLGEVGFQVMEIVADSGDIMGTPDSGQVLRRHYERITSLGETVRSYNRSPLALRKTNDRAEGLRRISKSEIRRSGG